jgi:hypothetical protein
VALNGHGEPPGLRVALELEASEVRFRAMADSAPVLVLLADTDKACVWFTTKWLAFSGRTLEPSCWPAR